MNSRKPSKTNLPNVSKPSKLLTPTRLRRTFVFSSLLNSAIVHSINQYQLANVPLKDVSMERMKVEEFGESKDEDCG